MDTKCSERSEVWDPGHVGLNGLDSGAKYCHSYRRSRLDMYFSRKCLKTGKSEGLYKNDGDVGWKGSIWRRTIGLHAISMGALPRAGVAMGQTFLYERGALPCALAARCCARNAPPHRMISAGPRPATMTLRRTRRCHCGGTGATAGDTLALHRVPLH
eukprot:SAG22_NODE_9858_length_565_cov_8.100858_1_plen_157_part_01